MVQYARLVFEEEILEGAETKEIINKLKISLQNFLKFMEERPDEAINDIELSEQPYERQE